MRMPIHQKHSRQGGFGAIMAIVVLVIMAGLAAGLLMFGTTQQLTLAADVQSANAYAAARAGLEAGLFKAISSTTPADTWKTCSAQSMTLDLSAQTGFHVTVTCNSTVYNEGESAPGVAATVRVYTIQAVACNSTACPDASRATSANYVERVRQVSATN